MLTRRSALRLLPASAIIGGTLQSSAQGEPSACALDEKNSAVLQTVFPVPDNKTLLEFIRADGTKQVAGRKDVKGWLFGDFLKKVREIDPNDNYFKNFFLNEEKITFGSATDASTQANCLAEFIKRAFEYPDPNNPELSTPEIEMNYFCNQIKKTRAVNNLVKDRYNDLFSKRFERQFSEDPAWSAERLKGVREDVIWNANRDLNPSRKSDPPLMDEKNLQVGELLDMMEELSDKIVAYLQNKEDGKFIYQVVKSFPKGKDVWSCGAQGQKYKEHRENLIGMADKLWRRAYVASILSPRAFLSAVQGYAIFYFIVKLFDDPKDYLYRERARGRVLNSLSIANDFFEESFSNVRTESSGIRSTINNLGLEKFPYLGTRLTHYYYTKKRKQEEAPNAPSQEASADYQEFEISNLGQSESITKVSQTVYTNYYLQTQLKDKSSQVFSDEQSSPPYYFRTNQVLASEATKMTSEALDNVLDKSDPLRRNKVMNDRKRPALTSRIPAFEHYHSAKFKILVDAMPGDEALERFQQYLEGINGLVNEVTEYYKSVQIIFNGLERLTQSFELLIARGGARSSVELGGSRNEVVK